jgi:hypothetical protein
MTCKCDRPLSPTSICVYLSHPTILRINPWISFRMQNDWQITCSTMNKPLPFKNMTKKVGPSAWMVIRWVHQHQNSYSTCILDLQQDVLYLVLVLAYSQQHTSVMSK